MTTISVTIGSSYAVQGYPLMTEYVFRCAHGKRLSYINVRPHEYRPYILRDMILRWLVDEPQCECVFPREILALVATTLQKEAING